MTWLVLILVRCVAVAFMPPPSFVWLRAIVRRTAARRCRSGSATPSSPNHPWWRGASDELPASGEFHAGSEAVLAAQTYLLEHALDKLAEERRGDTDLYFVGFAPYGRQDAYRKDLEAAQHVMDTRWDTDGRSLDARQQSQDAALPHRLPRSPTCARR